MIQAEDRADEQLQAIRELLNRLGLYENYITFYYIAYAVRFSLDDPEYLLMTTKLLYPKVAKQCGTTWMAVEHGIRYAIEKIWRKGNCALCTERVSALNWNLPNGGIKGRACDPPF